MEAQWKRQYDCKGRISRFCHQQESLEQKIMIQARSEAISRAKLIPRVLALYFLVNL
ncbi:hypothetical protein DPMN_077284 [Dreissena polymorpha]|uniref:Uncharacterized protein n=1 Tax=Dreissena polymorpha TaxID=45954 RepID=A0A9D4BP73_DREPO|nr:hypothetical protein DPMN_077284 [Dreissena polymorpha]